jgi:hypothetical protein
MIILEAEFDILPLISCGVYAMSDWLEAFWEDLLSEDPLRIMAAWSTLDSDEKATIHEHLTVMMTEDGWVDIQRQSARAALKTIDSNQS